MLESHAVTIAPLVSRDEDAWRALWAGYLDFYEMRLDRAVTDHTWRMLADPQSGVIGLGARSEGQLAGFATLVLHPRTWSIEPTAYLEDLFVWSDVRGHRMGRALIESALELARTRGCSSVYWHTHADNDRARRLYDRFVYADDFVRYRVAFGR